MLNNMDIVITYVNGNDPVWQRDYEKYTNVPILEKRFRDWGTLQYLLRGIEIHMPFIRNVYLVVSHRSQVPVWADTENLKVVLHEDFVPAEHLPTFNCNTLEMNLHRIEGLDEEYLYFNDDLFPVRDCKPEDFYRDGKALIGFTKHYFGSGMFKQICRNSDSLARKALGMPASRSFVRPQHICAPMLRSECERLSQTVAADIAGAYTRIRDGRNYNQYMFTDYLYYQGKALSEKISSRHLSVAVSSASRIRRAIEEPSRNIICINDVRLSEKRYEKLRSTIIEAFEKKFPKRSRFEK